MHKFFILVVAFLLWLIAITHSFANPGSGFKTDAPLQVISKYNSIKYGPADSLLKVHNFLNSTEYKSGNKNIIYLTLQITKDKVPVVFSKDDLNGSSGLYGQIKHYTFEELQTINLAENFSKINSDNLAIEGQLAIAKLSDFLVEMKDFLSKDTGNLVIFELKDSSLNPTSTLYLLAEYFSVDMLRNITFNSRDMKYKSLLSYYNYFYSNQLPVVCEVHLSQLIADYKVKKQFILPTEIDQCTYHGSVIITFDYSNITVNTSTVTSVLLQYLKFLNDTNPGNRIFLDMQYNLPHKLELALVGLGITGVLIDSDMPLQLFSALDLDIVNDFVKGKSTLSLLPKKKFKKIYRIR